MEQSFGVSLVFCGDGHKEGVTEKKKSEMYKSETSSEQRDWA